ncbi:hypothetical protein DFH29DRAFT_396977 [Suillus ampliporus]|nr:hypothetical protein DFH29DRAFT_396977 [Suillus ampliporus]
MFLNSLQAERPWLVLLFTTWQNLSAMLLISAPEILPGTSLGQQWDRTWRLRALLTRSDVVTKHYALFLAMCSSAVLAFATSFRSIFLIISILSS